MPSLDIDIDINTLNSDSGTGRRARGGSQFLVTRINKNKAVVPPENKGKNDGKNYPKFHKYWDAELQSYEYLQDFVKKVPDWLTEFKGVASSGRTLPQDMTEAELTDQVIKILDRVKDRGKLATEIIDQDSGEGALSFWRGPLKIDPVRHPATNLLLHVGRRVGEHVTMCLKGDFKSPRPSQLCPAISPLIDPPVTPSFPAGHAVQAYLISYLLAYSLPNMPQHTLPDPKTGARPDGLLFDLAARVADNRVVAGIHYPVDIEAGEAVAIACFLKLKEIDSIIKLQADIAKEFPQYA